MRALTTMRRFVILQHDHPRGRHWDLMLEMEDGLWTWALPSYLDEDGSMEAERLPDHRKAYLDHEGPIPGDRGSVRRCEAGHYELQTASELRLDLRLYGQRLRASVVLTRSAADRRVWRLETRILREDGTR